MRESDSLKYFSPVQSCIFSHSAGLRRSNHKVATRARKQKKTPYRKFTEMTIDDLHISLMNAKKRAGNAIGFFILVKCIKWDQKFVQGAGTDGYLQVSRFFRRNALYWEMVSAGAVMRMEPANWLTQLKKSGLTSTRHVSVPVLPSSCRTGRERPNLS